MNRVVDRHPTVIPTLPGYLAPDRAPANPPRFTLGDLDAAIGRYITATYHPREHSETRGPPVERWTAGRWMPRLPESLEQLDLLPCSPSPEVEVSIA